VLDFDFGLGEWIVRPQRCCIERGDEVVRLAPKAMAVLTRLAASAGEVVSRQELFDSVWPRVEVSDDALTQRIAELRRVLGDSPQEPRYIETIPKIGFRLIGSVAEIPEDSGPGGEIIDQPAAPASTRLGIIVIAGLFLLAVALFTLYPRATEEDAADVTAQAESPSIAVLPFANLSTDESTDYLCTGMADTILNMLAQNPDLHVTSGTSSFQPRLDGLTAPEIAELLGVTTVLEGSVQRQGTKLRITAQLIDAINDTHVWSRNFDLDDADIFAIEDEIAAAVTSAMHIVVREDVKQRIDHEGTDNAEAYDEYMKARSLVDAGKVDQVAVQHVERAIELDPEYALAYVLRGQLYGATGTWPELHVNEKIIRGREAANKATELAPDMPAALVLLAGYTDDWTIKGQLLRRAYENGPNDVEAILAHAQYLFWDPNPAESEALAHKALALDPLEGQTYWNLAILRMGEKRVDKALEIIERWKEKIPESTEARWMEGLGHFLRGNYSSQVAALLEAVELDPENSFMRVYIGSAYLLSGMPEAAQAWFESTVELEPESGWFNRGAQMVLNAYYQRSADEIFVESRQLLLDVRSLGAQR
jgi:TolB-like protein/DNA-binding winged helix-turn-helix (wHTH) protein